MASPCIITYKGKDYSTEEFSAMLHDGLLDQFIADKVIDGGKFGKVEKPIQETPVTKAVEKVTTEVSGKVNGPDFTADVKKMSRAEFIAKKADKFESKEEAAKYYDNTRDSLFNQETSALRQEISNELKSQRNNLSINPIGSTKVWSKMAQLMGLYFKKGITKVEDFASAAGYKVTAAIKALWNSVTRKGKTPKEVKDAPMTTLNARLYYAEAINRLGGLADAQAQIDALRATLDTFDIMAAYSHPSTVPDIVQAKNALTKLYQELSADIKLAEARINEEIALGEKVFDIAQELSLKDKALLALEDDMLWQKRAQESIEKTKGVLPDNMNPYMQRDISIGKTTARIDKVYQKIFGKKFGEVSTNDKSSQSMMSRMKKDGISANDLDLYMYAQHAKERNERVRVIEQQRNAAEVAALQDKLANATNPASVTKYQNKIAQVQARQITQEGSGMSDAKADQIIGEFNTAGKANKLDAYAQEFRDTVLKPTIDAYEEAGLITAEQAQMFRDGKSPETGVDFKYYVPLKVNEGMLGDAKGLSTPTISSTIKGIKGTGKYDMYMRNSPLSQAISDFKAAIKVSEENKTHIALHDLVKANPNEQVWEIVPATYIEENGQMREITDLDIRNNSVPVKINGKKKYIHLKHPGLREAWQGAYGNIPQFVRTVGNILRTFNNFKRLILTQLNPVFGAKNLIRDIQDAVFNASGLNIPMLGANVVKRVPKMVGALTKASLGNLDPSSPMGKVLDEYIENGGKVSWLDYDKIDAVSDKINSYNKPTTSSLGKIAMTPLKFAVGVVSGVNEAIELSTRVAVFEALRSEGISAERAASISKNLTVNFNKKGQLTPLVNTLYLFSNAGIQGNMTGLRNFVKSPKTRRYAAALALAGFGYAFLKTYLIDIMSKDDEEKKFYTDLISDGEREGQLIIPIGNRQFIRLPKSYGAARVFFNMGEELGQVAQGGDTKQHAYNLLGVASNMFDPIGGSTPNTLSAYTPTALRPFVEVGMNKKWNNTPIYPSQGYGVPEPDYKLFNDNVNPYFKDFTAFAYKASDGNIDISPETLEYITDDFTGGIIKEMKNATEGIMASYNKEPVNPNKIPFYGTFVTDMTQDQWRYSRYFYDLYNIASKRELTEKEYILMARYSEQGKIKDRLRKLKEVRKAQAELKKENQ